MTCYPLQWRIQDFKLGGWGVHLKKLCQAEGGAKMFGVFRVKNHDFTPKYHIFFNFREARAGCAPPTPPWIHPSFLQKLQKEKILEISNIFSNPFRKDIFYSLYLAKPLVKLNIKECLSLDLLLYQLMISLFI